MTDSKIWLPKKLRRSEATCLDKRGALVIHRKDDAFDGKIGVQCSPDPHEGVQELRNPFERQVFALNWNQDRVRRGKALRVRRPSAGGQSITMNCVIVLYSARESLLQLIFSILGCDQLDFCAHKILIRRDEIQSIDLSFKDDFFEGLAEHQGVVERAPCGILRKANSGRGIALGIAIDQKRALFRKS